MKSSDAVVTGFPFAVSQATSRAKSSACLRRVTGRQVLPKVAVYSAMSGADPWADTEGVTQIWSPGVEGLSAAVGRVVAGVAAADKPSTPGDQIWVTPSV